jgi:hypothetical protein
MDPLPRIENGCAITAAPCINTGFAFDPIAVRIDRPLFL